VNNGPSLLKSSKKKLKKIVRSNRDLFSSESLKESGRNSCTKAVHQTICVTTGITEMMCHKSKMTLIKFITKWMLET